MNAFPISVHAHGIQVSSADDEAHVMERATVIKVRFNSVTMNEQLILLPRNS